MLDDVSEFFTLRGDNFAVERSTEFVRARAIAVNDTFDNDVRAVHVVSKRLDPRIIERQPYRGLTK